MDVDEYQGPPPEGELITEALGRIRPKLSVREAARRAGISEGWWRQVVRGYQPLKGGGKAPMTGSAETIAAMANVVGLTPEQLEEAGRGDAAEELYAIREAPTARDTTDPLGGLPNDPAERIAELRRRVEQRARETQQIAEELARIAGQRADDPPGETG